MGILTFRVFSEWHRITPIIYTISESYISSEKRIFI